MVRRPLGSENGAVEGAEYALHWHQESPLRPGPTLTRAKIGLSISDPVWRNHHFFIVTITIIIHIMIINTSTVVVWLWMEQSGTAVRRTTAWSVKACPSLPSSSLLSCLSSLFFHWFCIHHRCYCHQCHLLLWWFLTRWLLHISNSIFNLGVIQIHVKAQSSHGW